MFCPQFWATIELTRTDSMTKTILRGVDPLILAFARAVHVLAAVVFLVSCGILMIGLIIVSKDFVSKNTSKAWLVCLNSCGCIELVSALYLLLVTHAFAKVPETVQTSGISSLATGT